MARQVVVTGAASGIGAAVSALLRGRGDEVIGVDLRDAEVVADLSTRQGRRDAAGAALRRAGGVVDAVVACAGTAEPTEAAVAVNYFGVVEFLGALRPGLVRAEEPRAAVISSISSIQTSDADVAAACAERDEERALSLAGKAVAEGRGYQLYAASKLALARWVRRTSVEPGWAGAGIPLNAVAPGVVVTPMTAALLSTDDGRALVDESVPMPLGGYAPPEAIAHALLWLVAPENTHMTGQVVFVDGGADATLRGEDTF
ncbi:SDR family oxidoreductase [Actinomadura sp. DC4]|uniref:SDR family oxidoreductase n=1 Tax=Actinomadura sp. DC4 TaxID=3055069 RepID=UPI0025B060E9|nr:SDR family oxidoreductase [Actinomadura sp. DC4]MDN3359037.1 SDR family oxidoreductase [Actinomadura sp. DC4]